MANGDPIIIGLPNTAENPGTTTSLTRDENRVETVFVARNLNEGDGIRGEASGRGIGVKGTSTGDVPPGGPDAYGVVGHREGHGFGAGVQGSSDSVMGVLASSKFFPAVYATAGFIDANGEAVGSTGTLSDSFGRGGIGVSSHGGLIGVLGEAGTRGNINSTGVVGRSSSGPGVEGVSDVDPAPRFPQPGVRGTSRHGVGVYGETLGQRPGVYGLGRETGVFGTALQGGRAGLFAGDVRVTGTLDKAGGGFRIDHPLDSANKYLTHSFVESDDMKNVYDGVATLDDSGAASVDLPEWFEVLNSDFRYQLTAVGGAAPNLHVAEEVSGSRFKIAGGEGGMKVCWQVTGIRQDPWADANRIEVEEEKAEGERGYYLHPDLYEQSEEQGIAFAAFPDEVRQIKQLEEGQLPGLPSVLDGPVLKSTANR